MNIIDISIIGAIALSALMSIKRGFVREVLSLFVWLIAFAVVIALHKHVAPLLERYISLPSLRNIAAMVVLFVITLMLGGVVSYILGGLIKATGLTSTDRFLGVVFGALRGVLIIALVVMFSKSLFSQDPWWQASKLIPFFEMLESWLKSTGSLVYELAKTFIFGFDSQK